MPQPETPSPFTRAGDVPVATMRSSYSGPSRRDPRTGQYVDDVSTGARVGNTVARSTERKAVPPQVVRMETSYRPADGEAHRLHGIPEADLPPFEVA